MKAEPQSNPKGESIVVGALMLLGVVSILAGLALIALAIGSGAGRYGPNVAGLALGLGVVASSVLIFGFARALALLGELADTNKDISESMARLVGKVRDPNG